MSSLILEKWKLMVLHDRRSGRWEHGFSCSYPSTGPRPGTALRALNPDRHLKTATASSRVWVSTEVQAGEGVSLGAQGELHNPVRCVQTILVTK